MELLPSPPSDHRKDFDDDLSVDTEFYFQWHITERCNRRCRHCYHSTYESVGELTAEQLLDVAARIEAALAAWDRRGAVSLTGGEPWLRGREVVELIDRFSAGGRVDRVDLLSNGVLLDDVACAQLAQRPLLRRVQVSIEGASATTHDAIRGAGSFVETRSAVRRLKRHGLTVSVMMTVSRHNAHEVDAVLDLLAGWDVDVFAVDRFIPEGQAEQSTAWLLSADEVREVFGRVHSWGTTHQVPRTLMYRPLFCLVDGDSQHVGAMCSVGVNALTILHDGTIYPCRRLPLPLGNVLRDSLHDIWYSSPVLWQARDPANLKGRCASCDHVPVCRGCRAMAMAVCGDWLEQDPQCWL